MRKALVTGAAGFIGSRVVRVLLEDGIDVRAMVLPGEDQRNLVGLDVEVVEANVLDPPSIDTAIKGCDGLFHLAAVYALWMRDWNLIYDVNLQGSRNMLWAAKRAEVEKVVYTSSISAVGIEPGKTPSNEDTPFNQYDLGEHYVITKHLSQMEALTFAREGLPVVVVNPAFPFGEGDVAPTPTGQIILDVANGLDWMTYEGGINIVDVDDVARGHLLAAKNGEIGEVYLLSGENVTLRELFEMVVRIVGLDVRIIKVPLPVAKLYGYLLVQWANISGESPTTTVKEVAYSNQFLFFDNTKAKTKLGYTTQPVEESLRRSIEWFKREGYIPRKGPLIALMKGLGTFVNRILPG